MCYFGIEFYKYSSATTSSSLAMKVEVNSDNRYILVTLLNAPCWHGCLSHSDLYLEPFLPFLGSVVLSLTSFLR